MRMKIEAQDKLITEMSAENESLKIEVKQLKRKIKLMNEARKSEIYNRDEQIKKLAQFITKNIKCKTYE